MTKIEPFEEAEHFMMLHTAIIDHVLPCLTGNAVKVLLVIMRANEHGYSMLTCGESIADLLRTTRMPTEHIDEALRELMREPLDKPSQFAGQFAMPLIVCDPNGYYALNEDFEFDVEDLPRWGGAR